MAIYRSAILLEVVECSDQKSDGKSSFFILERLPLQYFSEHVQQAYEFGGLLALVRSLRAFTNTYTNTSDHSTGYVAFSAGHAGSIVLIDLRNAGNVTVREDSVLALDTRVVESHVNTLGPRNNTHRMPPQSRWWNLCVKTDDEQRGNPVMVFLHASGLVIKKELAAQETISVDTACVVAVSGRAVTSARCGAGGDPRSILIGASPHFTTKLTGPGTVWMQSLPVSRLTDRVVAALRAARPLGPLGALVSLAVVSGLALAFSSLAWAILFEENLRDHEQWGGTGNENENRDL